MATELTIPDASVPIAVEGGRVNHPWYQLLSRLARLFNDATAAIDDGSTGLNTKLSQGKHTIWVPAGAMIPNEDAGPELVTTQLSNGLMLRTLDFDQTNIELAQFSIAMPKSWNEGALNFVAYWTAESGSGAVNWFLNARAFSNDDDLNQAFSAAAGVVDELIATGDLHVAPQSGDLTPDGSAAENDLLAFRIGRNPTNDDDTLTGDAKLIGVKVLYVVSAGNDE